MTTTVTERNTYIDVQDENGNIERHYPITKYENVMNVPDASEETAGVTKLYNDKGDNEDGSMTQKVITEKYSEFKYLTQAEYDVLPDTKLTDEIIYVITDGADTNGAIVYLTQAQYDLLPDTKLIDGLLYAITDAGTFGGNGGGGGNTTMIYLTQAQYDALPDTKLTDNLVYMITDAGTDLYGELATVSKTGSYNDLLDKPVIPDKSTIDSHISNSNIHVTTQDKAAWNGSYENSTAYTDLKINELVNGAPETLDTIKEVADAIEENETVMEALDSAIGTKANQSELDTHTSNTTSHITASERTAWNAKQNALTIDSNLSTTSTNPVQNKAVKSAIDNHTGDTAKHISATERTAWNKNTTDISTLNTDLTDVENATVVNMFNPKSYIDGITIDGTTLKVTSKADTCLFYQQVKSGETYHFTRQSTIAGNSLMGITSVLPTVGATISDYRVITQPDTDIVITPSVDGYLIVRGRVGGVYENGNNYQLEKGTVAHTYQPYIGADSIPKAVANKPTISEVIGNVEIETLKGKAKLFATNGNVPSGGYKVATCGRNALKTEDITNTTSGTNNGVTCSKNSNGLITMQGTVQSNFSIYAMNYGEYIMPFDGYIYPIVTSGNIGSFVVYFSKPDGQSVWATTNDVLAKGSKIVQIYQNLSTNDTINVSFYLAVSREKMTSYEPYVGDSATITDSNGVYLDTYEGATNIIAPNEVTTIYGGNIQGNELLKSDGTLNENLTTKDYTSQITLEEGVTLTRGRLSRSGNTVSFNGVISISETFFNTVYTQYNLLTIPNELKPKIILDSCSIVSSNRMQYAAQFQVDINGRCCITSPFASSYKATILFNCSWQI